MAGPQFVISVFICCNGLGAATHFLQQPDAQTRDTTVDVDPSPIVEARSGLSQAEFWLRPSLTRREVALARFF